MSVKLVRSRFGWFELCDREALRSADEAVGGGAFARGFSLGLSFVSSSFDDPVAVACTVREILLFIHKKVSS